MQAYSLIIRIRINVLGTGLLQLILARIATFGRLKAIFAKRAAYSAYVSNSY